MPVNTANLLTVIIWRMILDIIEIKKAGLKNLKNNFYKI